MTKSKNTYRRLCLVLIVVGGSLVWGMPLSEVSAASPGSLTDDTAADGENVIVSQSAGERDKQRPRRFVDADSDDETPVTVYVGETVDVSNVTLTDRTDIIGEGDVVLRNLDDGGDAPINATEADFSTVDTGEYSADANESAEIRVEPPRISALGLYETKDEENELISGRIDGGSTVYLDTRWNFDEADKLELTIRDPDGLDVTEEVVDADESESASGVVNASVDEGYVAEDGQDVALNFTGFEGGEYQISVEGSDFGPTRSTTVTVIRDPVSMSFESDPVFQGETAVANLTGLSDQTVYIRLDSNTLARDVPATMGSDGDVSVTNETAEQVFYGQEIIAVAGGETIGFGSDAELADDLFIVVGLGEDGEARFGIRTNYLEATRNVTFTVATEPDGGTLSNRLRTAESVDEVTLNVTERNITIQQAPDVVPTTDEFTIGGTAAGVEQIAVYARNNGNWERLNVSGSDNTASVSNGTFSLETTATGRFAIPDGYLLGLVSVDELETRLNRDAETATTLTSSEWNELETATPISIRTDQGQLSARLQSEELVVRSDVADEIELTGSASGQGDSLRLYVIGPRGNVYADDPALGRAVDVSNGAFEYEFGESLSHSGTYHVLVVGQGRDGSFAANESALRTAFATDRTPQQSVEIITDAYEQAGSDDRIVSLEFAGVSPSLTIETIGQADRVPPTTVPISGTTNRGDGREIAIDIVDANGTLVAATIGEINATTDTWTASVNFSGFTPGMYRVIADGPDLRTERNFTVVEPQEQAGQPAPRGEGGDASDDADNAGEQTGQPTEERPPTPGVSFFDSIEIVIVVLGVAILISLGLLARFRGER
ncbi:hypothetical protein [Salinigranum halophilum]|uniref:hypothetical protein n=1 Tax=Salinigranum halophilum TaxID=2565931 RepID=UPI0010A84029|nr:hypothetical protein [Salinigranum halophilum]